LFGTDLIHVRIACVASREQSLGILAGTRYTLAPLGAAAAAESADKQPHPRTAAAANVHRHTLAAERREADIPNERYRERPPPDS
jgi:hypothetical protein